jgi:ketosteroid isomerase-like protein
MSVDNVQRGLQNSTVQRNLAAHSRAVAAVVAREVPSEILAPGFRLENRVTAVTDYTYQGEAGWREWMSDLFEMFEEGAEYGEELITAGEDFVAANFRIEGVGARSGTPIQFSWVGVTWFRDGKATLAVGYPSRRDALRAVGLGDPSRQSDHGIRQARRIP